MQPKIKHILILFLLFISLLAVSQPKKIKFENLSLKDGLSQSSIRCISQDDKGFLWFGTLDGLNKYDGYSFKKYYSGKDSTTLPSNIINVIYKTKENDLIIGTDKGVCMYNKFKDNFIRINNDKNILYEKQIVEIKEDTSYIWFATKKKIFKFNKKTKQIFEFSIPSEFKNLEINKFYLSKGNIIILVKNFIIKINLTTKEYEKIVLKPVDGLTVMPQVFYEAKNNKVFFGTNRYFAEIINPRDINRSVKIIKSNVFVTDIVEDEHNTIWLGTKNKGLISYNIDKNKSISYTNSLYERHSLSVNYITSLFYSKEGILWIGTNLGGINKWNRLIEDIHVYRENAFNKSSLNSNLIRSIFIDSKDNIWIGTVDKGLNLWKREENIFIHYNHQLNKLKSLPNNHVRSIYETKNGELWIGTDGGGISKMNIKKGEFETYNSVNTNLASNHVWQIYEDSRNNFWVATKNGGLNLFDRKTHKFKSFRYVQNNNKTISSDNLTTIFEDSKGNLWIGTLDNGLNKFNYTDSSFTRFTHNKQDTTSIPFDRVYSIFEDSNNNIWLGLKGCLSLFDAKNKTFTNFDTNNGFPNNVIMGILEDKEQNLWLSTNLGICVFSKNRNVIKNYNINDGLQSNEFLVGSYFLAKNGEMYFGGIDGFNVFNPNKLKTNNFIPNIVITRYYNITKTEKLDTVISEKKEIFLNYDENIISFDFVSLNYIATKKNQYKVMLQGVDKNWIMFDNRRYVSYNNLPPGEYIFRVIGSNNDEVWNKTGASIKIHILPPWWETIWFRISVIVVLILIVIFIIKYRERKLRQEKEVLERKVKIRTKTIREQKEDIEKKNVELENLLNRVSTQRDEIETQRDEIEAQRDTVIEQKTRIEEIHYEISESINYAKRLQNAILPAADIKKVHLTDHFILFKPKDNVSGDFYWWTYLNDSVIITAVDCTGHGVPGAFMSLLGISFLREIVIKENIEKPSTILNRLRSQVISTLKQKGEIGEQKDGMDMALININYKTNIVSFAGANNPLYIIILKDKYINKTGKYAQYPHQNEKCKLVMSNEMYSLYEIKPNKMPIAIYDKLDEFTEHEIQLEKGDQLYMFSDGYADQFGGSKGKKLMNKPFKRILLENADKPMTKQKELLNNNFETWKGDIEQVDDVVVIGIKI